MGQLPHDLTRRRFVSLLGALPFVGPALLAVVAKVAKAAPMTATEVLAGQARIGARAAKGFATAQEALRRQYPPALLRGWCTPCGKFSDFFVGSQTGCYFCGGQMEPTPQSLAVIGKAFYRGEG